MQLQLGAQSAEAWMLDAAVVAWRLRTALDENLERNVTNYQLRVANTQWPRLSSGCSQPKYA